MGWVVELICVVASGQKGAAGIFGGLLATECLKGRCHVGCVVATLVAKV